jgi:tRNA U38,U39,U40 pseudouridine synthase TruA
MNLRRIFRQIALYRKAVEFHRVAERREIERKKAQRERDLLWVSMRGEQFLAAQNRIHLDCTARIATLHEAIDRIKDVVWQAECERNAAEAKQIALFQQHGKKFKKLQESPL